MLVAMELQQLTCNTQSNGDGSRPYLWVELLQINDDTINSGAAVALVDFPPSPDGAVVIVKDGMQAGDTAVVPDQMRHLAARSRSGQSVNELLLAVALLDRGDVPGFAMVDGYNAFLSDTREEIATNLVSLNATKDDPAARAALVMTIKTNLQGKVFKAITDDLDLAQKIALFFGTKDRVLDSAFMDVSLDGATSLTPFTLTFHSKQLDDFVISGAYRVTEDPCENERINVRAAQAAVANTKGALKQLAAQPETATTEKKLEQLRAELAVQQARLSGAKQALSFCENSVVIGPGGGSNDPHPFS
jgi:hypothetical protein